MSYADPEAKKLCNRQYHVLNKDKINARSKAWRIANKMLRKAARYLDQ